VNSQSKPFLDPAELITDTTSLTLMQPPIKITPQSRAIKGEVVGAVIDAM
jgi:hypothetical protein